ncbi:MAG: pantoate--beta-alanine ligase [Ignavibacteriaceae bacterium]
MTGIGEIQSISKSLKQKEKTIGLVPTMGALHAGHLSLVERCKSECDITIVSIFVNPTQFAPNEDLEKYPRNLERDKKLLLDENVDYIFFPDKDQIYPYNFQTYVSVEKITKILEGEFRPIHFRGVTTIVNILFNCVKPDYAYFGQKDAQQVAVIQQMVSDLKMGIDIVVCPIVRESDGLAMSSRNVYLSSEEREMALTLHKALLYGRKLIEEDKEMNPHIVLDNMKAIIYEEKSIKLDYVAIVNAYGFKEVDLIEGGNEYYILIAAKVGNTRLIDNEFITLS